MSSRTLVLLLIAGAILRLLLLPLPGTIDVQTQKLWSHGASTDVTGIYGVGGDPPERRMVQWLDLSGPVDYPPLAVLELAPIGRVYRLIDPEYADSAWLTVLIKTPGLIAEVVFVALLLTGGRRLLGGGAARWAAAAFWMNPAIWFTGSALGYVDAQGAVPGAIALLAAWSKRPALAGALIAIAAATKPQTVYLLPIVTAIVARRERVWQWADLGRAAIAGAVVSAAILAPFVIRGALPNMLLGVSRLLHHDMLSGGAANVGWIATWTLRVWYAAPDMGWIGALGLDLRILQITRVLQLGYPDPRPLASALVIGAAILAAWRATRASGFAEAAALAGWTIYAYTMFGIPVHENHFYPAVPLLVIAAAMQPPLRSIYWTTSAIFAMNIYLQYGLSRGWPPLIDRRATYIDLTLLLAVVNVVVFVWTTRRVFRSGGRAASAG